MEQIPFPSKKYQIIYADPPWDSNSQFGRDKKRGNKQHYPLMSIEDIKQFDIRPVFLGSPVSEKVLPPITLNKAGNTA